jgi:hypothetical protein
MHKKRITYIVPVGSEPIKEEVESCNCTAVRVGEEKTKVIKNGVRVVDHYEFRTPYKKN